MKSSLDKAHHSIFNNKNLKRLYKSLSVFLGIIWFFLAVFAISAYVTRKYVYPLKYKTEILYYAETYGLNSALVFAVVKTESSFDQNAISSAGAVGLMQITKPTGAFIAQKLGINDYQLLDAQTNLNFGCFYLRYLFNRFSDEDTALVAYNAGEGNVALWLNNPDYSKDGQTLFFIPFNESREYIKKIHKNFEKYEKLYGNILDKSKFFE